MSISYQEKSVYVNFVILLAIFGGYLGYAISPAIADPAWGSIAAVNNASDHRERDSGGDVPTPPC